MTQLDLDDDEARLVYADELQRTGDPRGELIVVQHRLALAPDDAAARAREAAILAEHGPALLGPIDGFATGDRFAAMELTWRLGFVHRVRLRPSMPATGRPDPLPDLDVMLAHPSMERLDELVLGAPDAGRWQHFDAYIPELVKAGPLLRLKGLSIGDIVEYTPNWGDADPRRGYPYIEVDISAQELGNLAPVWAAVPNLERLILQGCHFQLGDRVDLPELRVLEICTSTLARASLIAIERSPLTNLERLVVWFGDGEYGGGDSTVDDVVRLCAVLDGSPRLRHLGIVNAPFGDELCRALAKAPPRVLGRLHGLDLSLGALSGKGAGDLCKLAKQMPDLVDLNVAANFLSESAIAKLARAWPRCDVRAGAQRSGTRYVGVSE